MRYYPVNLDIQGRLCMVVGGGRVGTRKAKTLRACGAEVVIVSPAITAELTALEANNEIIVHRRPYKSSDLEGVFLIIGATDDETLNQQIHRDADRRLTLCNIADRPGLCNFILPAIVNRGDLVIAISTSGKSPAFAKTLRKDLGRRYGPEYALFLDLMGRIRSRLLKQKHAPEAHKSLFEQLIDGGLVQKIRIENESAINALLTRVLGEGYDYASLMMPRNGKCSHRCNQ